jgi:hypothetical protein
MKDVTVNRDLAACCGLYCGACSSYLKDRCPGCRKNVKASWCSQRKCCAEHQYATCADCKEFADARDCRHFNTFIARLMSVLFNSNRPAGVRKIRKLGTEGFAAFMAERKLMRLPRRSAAAAAERPE